MNSREAFHVLGIDDTKDLEQIKKAYRSHLVRTNPEDDPEGFKRLRAAYEAACAYARLPEEAESETAEKTQVDIWMEQVAETYETFSKRICTDCWKELLSADVCMDLDMEEEVKEKLFSYLMSHFRLLPDVWRLLDEHFLIEEEQQEFREQLPEDFIRYMIGQLHSDISFPYALFTGDEKADYDTWINAYFKLYDAIEVNDTELAGSIMDSMKSMGISHPLYEMEKARLLKLEGKGKEAAEKAEELLDAYPDEIRILILGSDLLWEDGRTQKAAQCYEKIIEIYPEHYVSNFRLGEYYAKQQEYVKAKGFLGVAGRINSQDEKLQECLKNINIHLIEKYKEQIASGEADIDAYIELGWCYLQNDEPEHGIEVLLPVTPDAGHGAAYHSIMERLYFSAKMPEKTETEGYAWIKSIEEESGSLAEEEKQKVPERIAAAYYIMGRAWMQEEDRDEKALECFRKSLEYYKYNDDLYIQMAIVLNRTEQFQEAVDICDRLMEIEPQNFWAYVYRMEAFFGMKKGQEVIEDFYKAKSIFPLYPPIYERAAEVFEIFGQYKDVLNIAEQAKEENVNSHKLTVFKLRAMNREAKTKEEVLAMLDEATEFLANLENTGEDRELKGEIYAEIARARGNIYDTKAALAYINRAIGISDKPIYQWLKGSFLIDLEEYEDALDILLACEKYFPDGDRVAYKIGLCYQHMEKPGKAAAYFEKTLEINPENQQANGKIAELYRELLMKNEDRTLYEKALVYADRQLELCPEAYFYIERGLLHMEAGVYAEAIKDFQSAAEEEPENIYAHNNLCACYRMLGDYEKAIETGKHAESLMKPRDTARVYGNLADCYMETGDYSMALDYYLRHQKQFPKGRSPMEDLVRVNFRLGRMETALYWISEAYKGNESAALYHKAEVYAWAGDGEKARLCLKDLLKGKYEPYKVKFLMAQVSYYFQRRNHEALKLAKQTLAETKPGTRYYMDAGILMEEIYYRAGKIKKAKKIAEQLLKAWKDRYGDAEKVLETWKSKNLRLSDLCQIYYFSGETEETEKYLTLMCNSLKCEECRCGHCSAIYYVQGLLWEQKQDMERAKQYYQLLKQEEPENIQCRSALERVR